MAEPRNNEFLKSLDDTSIRPYTVGMRAHEETLATVLLYALGGTKEEEDEEIDYLDTLNTQVQSLVSEPENTQQSVVVSGNPTKPYDGEITKIMLDGENDYYGIFNNFSLLNVTETSEQIVKIHINFGADWNAFFFGEKPKVYTFSGFFLDTMDYPYFQEFMVAYEKYLSGRKAIENNMRTKFLYDGRLVDGYMLGIRTGQTAADNLIKSFEFTVLVTGFHWIRNNVIPVEKKNPGDNESVTITEVALNAMNNTIRLKRRNLESSVNERLAEKKSIPTRRELLSQLGDQQLQVLQQLNQ